MKYGKPAEIAAVLNSLPMVQWDRFIEAPVESDHWMIVVYGWIARDDGQRDYVVLEFCSWTELPSFSTSSAKWSAQINEILYGPEAEHFDCQRVNIEFGDLVERKVVLA